MQEYLPEIILEIRNNFLTFGKNYLKTNIHSYTLMICNKGTQCYYFTFICICPVQYEETVDFTWP